MHISVLQKEVIEYLDPKPDENFIDATLGNAGHTLAILEKNGPEGKVLGIDQDPEQIENCKLKIKNFGKRVVLACDNFANLKEIVRRERFGSIQGIIFDLGMSSSHLTESGRGFSFLKNEPLDMRYDGNSKLTAEKILNYESCQEVERILREYGEENFSKKIAEKIIEARNFKPIKTTFQLVEIIKRTVPRWYEKGRIHPATRVFQALRIAVNDELDNLRRALPQAIEILRLGGKLVIVSFHSLEDRIVKNYFQEKAKENILKILTKKPVAPTKEEIKINPRSRSGRLRAAAKICLK